MGDDKAEVAIFRLLVRSLVRIVGLVNRALFSLVAMNHSILVFCEVELMAMSMALLNAYCSVYIIDLG